MTLLKSATFRTINFLIFLVSALGMGLALYLEHAQGLEPCPLCVFQRVGLILVGVFALIASLHNPVSKILKRLYVFLMFLSISWSFGVASRHVWMQHLPPDQVPSCGPGLEFWMEAFPLLEVFKLVLSGSGECAKVSASFLGFSIPEWSLLFFAVILIAVVYQFFNVKQKQN